MLGAAASPEGFHLTFIPLQIMKITLVITQPDHSRQLRNLLQSTHGLHNQTNVGLMLAQRRRRWDNIKPALGQRPVLAEIPANTKHQCRFNVKPPVTTLKH